MRPHDAICPDLPSERNIRSAIKHVERLLKTASGKTAYELVKERRHLSEELKTVAAAKQQRLQEQLAEIEAAKVARSEQETETAEVR